jgi:hypothetical protein
LIVGTDKEQKQADKFKEAAREHGADPSVKRWEGRLKKVAKAKPSDPPN